MLSNPLSLIILISSAALILGAVFSKRVRKINTKQLAALKEHEESLSVKEKAGQIKAQNWGILFIEIFFWLLILGSGLLAATKV